MNSSDRLSAFLQVVVGVSDTNYGMSTETSQVSAFARAIPIARAALRFPGTALQVILDAATDHVGALSSRAFHITEEAVTLLTHSGDPQAAHHTEISSDEATYVRALSEGRAPTDFALEPAIDWYAHTGRPIHADGYVLAIFAGRGPEPSVEVGQVRDELAMYMALAALGIETDRLSSELDDLRESRAILGATFRHDLRHPLQAITAAAALLSNEDEPLNAADRAEMLEMICSESDRLNAMLDATFADSVGHEHVPPKLQRVEIAEVVDAVVVSGRSAKKGRITLDIEPHQMTTDPVRLERALRNLIDNALKYSPPDAIIDVLGRSTADDYVIQVIDGGPGVEPELVHRLFTPFFKDANRIDSTGLGLASASSLVESLGGRIHYSRRERTVFEMVVPLDSSRERSS